MFTSIVWVPVGIASASLTLFFSLTTGIVKKLLNITRNKKTKHDKILMFAKSKLYSIETLIPQTLIDMEYEKMKENFRSENEKHEIMRLSSIKTKT